MKICLKLHFYSATQSELETQLKRFFTICKTSIYLLMLSGKHKIYLLLLTAKQACNIFDYQQNL